MIQDIEYEVVSTGVATLPDLEEIEKDLHNQLDLERKEFLLAEHVSGKDFTTEELKNAVVRIGLHNNIKIESMEQLTAESFSSFIRKTKSLVDSSIKRVLAFIKKWMAKASLYFSRKGINPAIGKEMKSNKDLQGKFTLSLTKEELNKVLLFIKPNELDRVLRLLTTKYDVTIKTNNIKGYKRLSDIEKSHDIDMFTKNAEMFVGKNIQAFIDGTMGNDGEVIKSAVVSFSLEFKGVINITNVDLGLDMETMFNYMTFSSKEMQKVVNFEYDNMLIKIKQLKATIKANKDEDMDILLRDKLSLYLGFLSNKVTSIATIYGSTVDVAKTVLNSTVSEGNIEEERFIRDISNSKGLGVEIDREMVVKALTEQETVDACKEFAVNINSSFDVFYINKLLCTVLGGGDMLSNKVVLKYLNDIALASRKSNLRVNSFNAPLNNVIELAAIILHYSKNRGNDFFNGGNVKEYIGVTLMDLINVEDRELLSEDSLYIYSVDLDAEDLYKEAVSSYKAFSSMIKIKGSGDKTINDIIKFLDGVERKLSSREIIISNAILYSKALGPKEIPGAGSFEKMIKVFSSNYRRLAETGIYDELTLYAKALLPYFNENDFRLKGKVITEQIILDNMEDIKQGDSEKSVTSNPDGEEVGDDKMKGIIKGIGTNLDKLDAKSKAHMLNLYIGLDKQGVAVSFDEFNALLKTFIGKSLTREYNAKLYYNYETYYATLLMSTNDIDYSLITTKFKDILKLGIDLKYALFTGVRYKGMAKVKIDYLMGRIIMDIRHNRGDINKAYVLEFLVKHLTTVKGFMGREDLDIIVKNCTQIASHFGIEMAELESELNNQEPSDMAKRFNPNKRTDAIDIMERAETVVRKSIGILESTGNLPKGNIPNEIVESLSKRYVKVYKFVNSNIDGIFKEYNKVYDNIYGTLTNDILIGLLMLANAVSSEDGENISNVVKSLVSYQDRSQATRDKNKRDSDNSKPRRNTFNVAIVKDSRFTEDNVSSIKKALSTLSSYGIRVNNPSDKEMDDFYEALKDTKFKYEDVVVFMLELKRELSYEVTKPNLSAFIRSMVSMLIGKGITNLDKFTINAMNGNPAPHLFVKRLVVFIKNQDELLAVQVMEFIKDFSTLNGRAVKTLEITDSDKTDFTLLFKSGEKGDLVRTTVEDIITDQLVPAAIKAVLGKLIVPLRAILINGRRDDFISGMDIDFRASISKISTISKLDKVGLTNIVTDKMLNRLDPSASVGSLIKVVNSINKTVGESDYGLNIVNPQGGDGIRLSDDISSILGLSSIDKSNLEHALSLFRLYELSEDLEKEDRKYFNEIMTTFKLKPKTIMLYNSLGVKEWDINDILYKEVELINGANKVTKKEAVKLRDMVIKRLSKLLTLIIKNGTAVESVYSETSSALLMAKSKGIEKTLEEIKQNI